MGWGEGDEEGFRLWGSGVMEYVGTLHVKSMLLRGWC